MKREEGGLNFIFIQDQSSPQDFGKARGHAGSAFQMKKTPGNVSTCLPSGFFFFTYGQNPSSRS